MNRLNGSALRNKKLYKKISRVFIGIIILTNTSFLFAQSSDFSFEKYEYAGSDEIVNYATIVPDRFKGYTDHWDEFYWQWVRYSGLFSYSVPEVKSEIIRMEDQIGNQLLLEELWIQVGFVYHLSKTDVQIVRFPSPEELEQALKKGPVIVLGTDRDKAIQNILSKLPEEFQFRRNRAFSLENGENRLFVIACQTRQEAERLYKYIDDTILTLAQYRLEKGIAGYHTGYYIVTNWVENPLDVIAKALYLRCSWVLTSGYDDWMMPELVGKWLRKIDFPYVFLPGQYMRSGGVMYGMERYPQIQDHTTEQCVQWTKEHKGYIFRDSETENADKYDFDGWVISNPDDEKRILDLRKPFITNATSVKDNVPPTMVLFLEKNVELSQTNILETIMNRRAVAVFENGTLAGLPQWKIPLQILLLDRLYLEETFQEKAEVAAKVTDENLIVKVRNNSLQPFDANLLLRVPDGIIVGSNVRQVPVSLNGKESITFTWHLTYDGRAAGEVNPIGVILNYGGNSIRTLTHLDIPQPLETHQLLFDLPGTISFPFTLWNWGDDGMIKTTVEVFDVSGKNICSISNELQCPHGKPITGSVELPLPEGEYKVKTTALGKTVDGQISIKAQQGQVTSHFEDIDKDGTNEIVMENNQVRASILLTGGRVIEYILKSRNENLLFKLWPELPPWADQPRGKRAFWPWGGLEEFIGYPTIEGHINFNYKIEKESGNYVRIRVWANIHGNKIEKIITLYGDSPLLEVRYTFENMDKNINIIGVNPLVQIGPSTGPEDVYYFPTATGIEERRPRIEPRYGSIFFQSEGWVAGFDTEMKTSLIVGYPVNGALFMHLWNNTPGNQPTPYYYTELQPWIWVQHGTTTYFTFYLYGYDGQWENAVEQFRNLGIVTKK